MTVIYRQTDYSDILGSGPGTIHDYGCYLTSFADLLTWSHHPIDPPAFNNVVKSMGLFESCGEGDIECLDDQTLHLAYPPLWTAADVRSCEATSCPQDWLNNDDPNTYVIVRLKIAPPFNTHFAPVWAWREWSIADPMLGDVRPISHYGDPATVVTKVVRYQYVGDPRPPVDECQFVGIVVADGGGFTHSRPGTEQETQKRLLQSGAQVLVDRWCQHGEKLVINQGWPPDDRWFHLADGSDEWMASAIVRGDPPANCPAAPDPSSA